jgi:hypothetical protein
MFPACIRYPECIPTHSEQIMYPCILDTFEMHVSRRVLMSQILRGEIHVQLTTGPVRYIFAKNQDKLSLRQVSAGCDATWQIMRTSDRPASDRPVFPFFLVRRLRSLWILCVAFRKPARNSFVNTIKLVGVFPSFPPRFLGMAARGSAKGCRKQS